jgi:hypothetical protein
VQQLIFKIIPSSHLRLSAVMTACFSGVPNLMKMADFGTGIVPLFPVAHPHPAAEPFVNIIVF